MLSAAAVSPTSEADSAGDLSLPPLQQERLQVAPTAAARNDEQYVMLFTWLANLSSTERR
jgi:hypothetical protein